MPAQAVDKADLMTQLTAPTAILRSKITPPVLSGTWVPRPQIETRLDRTLARSLTVVTAPAGHGKTSSITNWLRAREIDAAWVTCDARDTDLTRLATHVAAALEQVAPGVSPSLFALLMAPDRLAPSDLGEAFGDVLYDLDRDVVLVLDDVHEVDTPGVTAFLSSLVQTAPRRLHTILSSRSLPPFPLSRLRTKGDVEELSGADLRFSARETGELLHLETGQTIRTEVASNLQASVGGWPAAIRLLALSRSSGDDGDAPSGSSRQQERLVLDYLGDEVLSRLTPAQRTVLLRASLVDRFNTPLLEHLAATHDGERIGRADLERLRALELYREIPGLSDTWFAYHALFRDALRREFERSADAVASDELHRSVAEWFTNAGFTREAVHHLVAINDFAGAVALIGSKLNDAFAREDWRSISSWLHEIPREEIEKSPELLLASAWVGYLSGRDARTAEVLAALRTPRIRNQVTRAQRAEMTLLADWPEGRLDAMVQIAEEAITLIPAQKRYRTGYAQMTLGMVLTSLGRAEEALAGLAAFTDRESGRIDAASIRGYFGRAIVLWQQGRLTLCEQTAADLLQLARSNDLSTSAGWGAMILGHIAHERGDLNQTSRHLEAVFADAEQVHFMCLRDAFFAQILAYHAQGLYDEADRALARFREHIMATETRHHLDVVDSLNARTALIRGDLVTAHRWLDVSPAPYHGQTDLKTIEQPVLTRAKVLISKGSHDALEEADQGLTAFVNQAQETHMALALIEGLAVQALLYETQGDQKRAGRALQSSLSLAAPEGIVQRYAYLGPTLAPILRRILAGGSPMPHAQMVLSALEQVLAAQPALNRNAAPITPEQAITHSSLSERERQVLRCLSRRLTNNEIGDELYISPITVKNHVAHITEKLGVSGRRAAVQRADELGLLAAGA